MLIYTSVTRTGFAEVGDEWHCNQERGEEDVDNWEEQRHFNRPFPFRMRATEDEQCNGRHADSQPIHKAQVVDQRGNVRRYKVNERQKSLHKTQFQHSALS